MSRTIKEYFPERSKGYFGEDYIVVVQDPLRRASLKWTLMCEFCEKTFSAVPLDIFRGNISCACGYRYYKTTELKVQRLLEVLTPKQITFDTDIKILHSHQKIDLKCNICNLEWKAAWTTLVNRQSGCAKCVGRYSYSDEEYIEKINSSGGAYKYVSKDFDHKIFNRDCVNVQCLNCDLIWSKTVSDAVVGKHGCPACQTNGYNPSQNGYFYILSIKKDSNLLGYKFGISNYPEKRLKGITRKSDLKIKMIALFKFEDGAAAQSLESNIKKSFGNFLTKKVIPDGYTETICATELNDLITIIYKRLGAADGLQT